MPEFNPKLNAERVKDIDPVLFEISVMESVKMRGKFEKIIETKKRLATHTQFYVTANSHLLIGMTA